MAAIFNKIESMAESGLLELLEMEKRRADRLEIEKLWFQYAKGKRINLDYFAVSIYGAGTLGIELNKLLRESKIQVVFFIDRKSIDKADSVKVYRPDDELPYTDLMIVTLAYDYWDIRYRYVNRGFNVISIMDILNGFIE